MRVKKVADSEHGPRHVTPAGRSVFYDLFPAEKAAEMEMRRGRQGAWSDSSTRVRSEARQDRPIQHGLAGTVGSARRTQAQAETRSVRRAVFGSCQTSAHRGAWYRPCNDFGLLPIAIRPSDRALSETTSPDLAAQHARLSSASRLFSDDASQGTHAR
jgi:hypothetical protein